MALRAVSEWASMLSSHPRRRGHTGKSREVNLPSRTMTSPLMTLRSTKPIQGVRKTSPATTSCCPPANPMLSVRQATKSAAKPGAISPMSVRPRLRAPPFMPSSSASRASSAAHRDHVFHQRALFVTSSWALFITPSRLCPLPHHGLCSLPRQGLRQYLIMGF